MDNLHDNGIMKLFIDRPIHDTPVTSIRIEPSTKKIHSICSQRMFSTDSLHTICWELQLQQKGKCSNFRFGYVDAEHINLFNERKWIGNKNGFGLIVEDGEYPSFWEKNWEYIINR